MLALSPSEISSRKINIKHTGNRNKGVFALKVDSVDDSGYISNNLGNSRGQIRGFSSRASKRLMDLTQIIDDDLLKKNSDLSVKFITLTYPFDFPDAITSKKHLRKLEYRLDKICNEYCWVWRLEFQKRGAPHFHIMAYNLPNIHNNTLKDIWRDCIGYPYGTLHTRIEKIKSSNGVKCYISKYISKKEEKRETPFFNCLPYLKKNTILSKELLIDSIFERFFSDANAFLFDENALESTNHIFFSLYLSMTKRYYKKFSSSDFIFNKENLNLIKDYYYKDFYNDLKNENEIQYANELGLILKYFMYDEELDILCPVIGRQWGIKRKHLFKFYEEKLKNIPYSEERLEFIKSFCTYLRQEKRIFNNGNEDGGMTFYYNDEHEYKYFLEVLGVSDFDTL